MGLIQPLWQAGIFPVLEGAVGMRNRLPFSSYELACKCRHISGCCFSPPKSRDLKIEDGNARTRLLAQAVSRLSAMSFCVGNMIKVGDGKALKN